MKKYLVFLSVLFLIVSLPVQSQSIGLKGGVSLAKGSYKYSMVKQQTHFSPGLCIGLSGELPVSDVIFLNSGFMFVKKGTIRHIANLDQKIPVSYLEIPVTCMFKNDFISWKLFGQAGIYAGIGLSAKSKRGNDKNKIEFGTELGQFKRMDYGVNLGAGVELYNNVQFLINYGFGFRDISGRYDEKIRNRVFTITVFCPFKELTYLIQSL
ncbi:MAG TPA: porin family protein [Bacteroidales bacterium]|jgi:hypothetical protein|nr:PorT family protein [Bacteroidales bacterium]HPY67023.1 porin family protein [Bacteroidales bacterium]HQB36127.1 porin family protein [Bacteroidales bacterium]